MPWLLRTALSRRVRACRSRPRVCGSVRLAKTAGDAALSLQWPLPPRTPHNAHIATPAEIERLSGVRGLHRSALPWMAAAEIVGDLVEGAELHARMLRDIVEHTLQHQQHLRPPRDVGMNGHGEHRVIVFAIDPVELVAPQFFDVARLDEAVAVRRTLDEHHRRQVVEIPASRNID